MMNDRSDPGAARWPAPELIVLPGLKLLIHLVTSGGYGYFRDEFYYIACSERLAFGYVDHPPLSIALLWISRHLFGDSLLALRLFPAIAGALTVLLAGRIAGAIGGGRFARILAMTAALVAPIYLGLDHFYSMNAFDLLVWSTTAYLLVRLLRGESARLWILLGIVLGAGLLNKISVLWLGFGLLVGLLATSRRRWLLTRWPWVSGGIAGLLFTPYIFWQIRNGWPTLEFIHNATTQKMAAVAPLDFIIQQASMMNPITLPLWLAGLGFLLFGRDGRPYRILGWIYLTVFLILVLSGSSRPGYLSPAYIWLFAAGGRAWEEWIRKRSLPYLKESSVTLVAMAGLVLAPMALPILPVEAYISYSRSLGFAPSTSEKKELARLPQHYADMHGWDAIVESVAEAYESLPPGDRAEAVIFTFNYGEAGAIDFLGRQRDLPPALSGHNNYWLWGSRGSSGAVVIFIGSTRERLERHFDSVERAGTTSCGYCMPYENDQPIWIARNPRVPLDERWPDLKHFD